MEIAILVLCILSLLVNIGLTILIYLLVKKLTDALALAGSFSMMLKTKLAVFEAAFQNYLHR